MYGIKDCTRNIAPWSAVAGEFLTAKKDHNNHGQKSWDTFAFLGHFLFCKGPTPPLTRQTKLDACIQDFFPSFNFVIGWGRENCKKILKRMHVFMREPRNDTKILNTALLSQGLLSMIVDAVPLAVNNKLERTVYNHNIASCMAWELVRGTLHHDLWWQVNSLRQKRIITTKK